MAPIVCDKTVTCNPARDVLHLSRPHATAAEKERSYETCDEYPVRYRVG